MMSLRSLFFRSASPRRKPRHGNSQTAVRSLAQRFLRVEALETRTMLAGAPLTTTIALVPDNTGDSGIAPYAETFTDRVTNVTEPALTGTYSDTDTQAGTITVKIYTSQNNDGSPDVLLGSATVQSNGTWSFAQSQYLVSQ